MAKTVSQREKLEQKLGRLQLRSMKLASELQTRQEAIKTVREEQVSIAQKLLALESKTKD